GFTTGAMPGFIVRAVPSNEVGSATGFYQVIRGIGLSLGSALSAAVLLMHTPDGAALPALDGFRTVLVLAAGLCVVTAVVSYLLPGRHSAERALSAADAAAVDTMSEEDAELSGAGFLTTEE